MLYIALTMIMLAFVLAFVAFGAGYATALHDDRTLERRPPPPPGFPIGEIGGPARSKTGQPVLPFSPPL
jgi:hypothetical protein